MITKKVLLTPSNKKIVIYDNLFSNQESLDIFLLLGNFPYFRTNIDLPIAGIKDINTKFVSNIGQNDRLGQLLFEKYTINIDELPMSDARIMNQYVNYSTFGTVDQLHSDATSFHIDPTYTILQYANFKWEVDWHGQTVFYTDDHSEIFFSSVVKPGRVLVFDSTIPHSATGPSKLAEYPRFTIATKLVIPKNEC